MVIDDLESEITKTADELSNLIKEYDLLCQDLSKRITEYAKKYNENTIKYLLGLPKEEQVLILRNLDPVVDNLLFELDNYRHSMNDLSNYVMSLKNQYEGSISKVVKRTPGLLN
jgi:hypothetical protein